MSQRAHSFLFLKIFINEDKLLKVPKEIWIFTYKIPNKSLKLTRKEAWYRIPKLNVIEWRQFVPTYLLNFKLKFQISIGTFIWYHGYFNNLLPQLFSRSWQNFLRPYKVWICHSEKSTIVWMKIELGIIIVQSSLSSTVDCMIISLYKIQYFVQC